MSGADVVVVGAGSAGCVMAARLAEDPNRSVVLLEAGPDLRASPPPAMHDGWRTYREHDWGLSGEWPDGRADEPLYRGRLVGGTSWVTRFAMRGSPADFDGWARMGNSGWSYDEVLPSFIRVENDLDFGGEPWHGVSGPLPITRYPEIAPSEFETAVLSAFAANGFRIVEDLNAPDNVGAGRMPRSSRAGRRQTGADAFLPFEGSPTNLQVRPDGEVAAVELRGDRATGVRLVDGSLVAADWVVLCAGTYGSPVILLRSGIGPADHLRQVGVPVGLHLRGVGANLADHPGVELDTGFSSEGRDPRFFWLASFHSSLAKATDPPDLALWAHDPFGDPAESGIAPILLTPASRGRIELRSADPGDAPRITLPGMQVESDVRRMLEALERAEAVVSDPALRAVCAAGPTQLPDSADERRAWLRQELWPFPHTVGTCAMGPSPDLGAVVDQTGRLHGLTNVTVADASIIPTAPSGFPHLISIILADRIAETVGKT